MSRCPRILWVVVPWALACGASGSYREWEASSPRAVEPGGQLGPGDLIEVKVFRENDLSGLFQVAPDGTIDFPLIGTLQVAGSTAPEVASTIRQRLGDGYLRNPHVTVLVKEVQSRRIYVLGQVERPGTFKYEEGMTVVQAITLAGGFTKTARPDATVVTRVVDGRETRFVVPVEEISRGTARNLPLLPGDIVFVPQSIL